jgi:hypothetical protein
MSAALPYVPPTPSPLVEAEAEDAAQLASQWPKRCAKCRKTYSRSAFGRLPLVQRGGGRATYDGDVFEFRDCPCGNTLTVILGLGDE